MRNSTRTFIAAVMAGSVSVASASPILSVSDEGEANAQAAETVFLDKLKSGYLTESFDSGYTVGDQSLTINSQAGVGSFTSDVQGTGGACDDQKNGIQYKCADGLAVLDSDSSPFNGRFDISEPNWLDSMDAQELTFSPAEGFNAVGFFMTDPNDAGGRFDIGGDNYSFDDIFGGNLGSGKVFYISLYDEAGLGDLTIVTNNSNDGYGIDGVTVGQVPEPGTLALLGLGLVGLVVARRRVGNQDQAAA